MGYKLRAPSYESQVGHSGRPASSEIDADDVDLCDRWKCQMKFRISANLWTGRTINWPGETEQFGVNLACGESREKVISCGNDAEGSQTMCGLKDDFEGDFRGKMSSNGEKFGDASQDTSEPRWSQRETSKSRCFRDVFEERECNFERVRKSDTFEDRRRDQWWKSLNHSELSAAVLMARMKRSEKVRREGWTIKSPD